MDTEHMYPSNNEKGRIFFMTRKKEKKTRNGDKCIEITLMAPHKCKDHDGNLVPCKSLRMLVPFTSLLEH